MPARVRELLQGSKLSPEWAASACTRRAVSFGLQNASSCHVSPRETEGEAEAERDPSTAGGKEEEGGHPEKAITAPTPTSCHRCHVQVSPIWWPALSCDPATAGVEVTFAMDSAGVAQVPVGPKLCHTCALQPVQ
jgi:hypothetical protein